LRGATLNRGGLGCLFSPTEHCHCRTAGGAPQIFVSLGGLTILIRGQRSGEALVSSTPIRLFADFSSHDAPAIDHFGFTYQDDLTPFCDKLRAKGVARN
jgi:hypothetical protein